MKAAFILETAYAAAKQASFLASVTKMGLKALQTTLLQMAARPCKGLPGVKLKHARQMSDLKGSMH